MKKILISLFITVFLFSPIIVKGDEVDLAPGAKSAVLLEPTTGEILYEKNSHEKYSPASMTKMMTMLLVMEHLEGGGFKLDDMIKISENASSMGGSQIYLETGESMSVEDLIKGVAIASGNDAAVALSEAISGSEELFVQRMNERAKELGLKNTNFKNPTGLDEANHYSTAYDMSMIARELVSHENILKYTSIYEDYLRPNTDKKVWLVNTNKLVRFYDGVDGLKTGYTTEAGYCLTATAKRGNLRLIAVVMGEEDSKVRNAEISKMLDYGFSTREIEKLLTTDSNLGYVKVEKGKLKKVEINPLENINVLNRKGLPKRNVTYKLSLNVLKAPIKKGDNIGSLDIIEDDKVINRIGVTVKEDVKKASILNLFTRYFNELFNGEIS